MRRNMRITPCSYISLVALSLLLAACGGGGDEQAFVEAVEVNELNITAIEIASDNRIIETGTVEFYRALGHILNDPGNTIDVTDRVNWSTSDGSVASINQSGIVNGLADGIVDVRAEWADLVATEELEVSSAALQSITVNDNPSPVSLCSYGYQLSASGQYVGEADQRNISKLVTWTSTNDNVALIDGDGVISTYMPGSVTLTATRNAIPGTAALTVSDDLDFITVTPDAPTINTGADQQFTATATYDDASTGDITPTVSWVSETEAVLSISNELGEKGLATGLVAGTSNVTADCNGEVSPPELVTVEQPAVLNGVQIDNGDLNVRYDTNDSSPVQLRAYLSYSDGSIGAEITDDTDSTWQVVLTNSGTAATVSNTTGSKGEVSFSAIGDTEIRVTYDDGTNNFKASIDFIVEAP